MKIQLEHTWYKVINVNQIVKFMKYIKEYFHWEIWKPVWAKCAILERRFEWPSQNKGSVYWYIPTKKRIPYQLILFTFIFWKSIYIMFFFLLKKRREAQYRNQWESGRWRGEESVVEQVWHSKIYRDQCCGFRQTMLDISCNGKGPDQ